MTENHLEFSIVDGIARLRLCRAAKRNALQREIIEQMVHYVEDVAGDDSVRVFCLSADGPVFCAGMDLGEMQARAEASDKQQQWQRDSEVYCQLLSAIYSLPVPTVAAVQGPALAGGMGLVLACDIVVGTEAAFFALPEPARGITAAMVTPFLVHRIGSGPATYLLLSGRRVSAEEAQRSGLVHRLVGNEGLDSEIESLIQSILTGSPRALAITKKHVGDCAAKALLDQVQQSIEVSAIARETDDAREGLAAFLEKRKPKWQS